MDPVFQMFLRYRVGVNAMRPNGNCQNSTATEFIVYTVSGRVSAIFFVVIIVLSLMRFYRIVCFT